jgi:hypothetical protein
MELWVSAAEASPSRVALTWRARAELPYAPEVSPLHFDPELGECDDVRVLVAAAEDPRPSPADGAVIRGFAADARTATENIWNSLAAPPCTILAVVGEVQDMGTGPRLLVSNEIGPIGTVKLETPRNPWWIPVVGLGFVGDVTIVPLAAAALSCATMPIEGNFCAWLLYQAGSFAAGSH